MTTLQQAIQTIQSINLDTIENGKYVVADDFYYNVFEYEPKLENEIEYEALELSVDYNDEKDVAFYKNSDNQSCTILRPGSLVVLYPKDAHKSVRVENGVIKKIVGKLLVH